MKYLLEMKWMSLWQLESEWVISEVWKSFWGCWTCLDIQKLKKTKRYEENRGCVAGMKHWNKQEYKGRKFFEYWQQAAWRLKVCGQSVPLRSDWFGSVMEQKLDKFWKSPWNVSLGWFWWFQNCLQFKLLFKSIHTSWTFLFHFTTTKRQYVLFYYFMW